MVTLALPEVPFARRPVPVLGAGVGRGREIGGLAANGTAARSEPLVSQRAEMDPRATEEKSVDAATMSETAQTLSVSGRARLEQAGAETVDESLLGAQTVPFDKSARRASDVCNTSELV